MLVLDMAVDLPHYHLCELSLVQLLEHLVEVHGVSHHLSMERYGVPHPVLHP